jgi:hypothetical protein
MTAKQFQKKAEIARKTGSAYIENGCILYFDGYGEFTAKDPEGNTITTAYDAMKLAYLFD